MKITFLGTGTSQGTPLIGCNCQVCKSADNRDKRLRSSVLIDIEGQKILIDAGPDFRQQMLQAGVSKLDAILLTHEHIDHVGGLDDVRALNYINDKAVDIYAEERVQEALHKMFFYAFEAVKYPGIPEFAFHTINENNFYIDKLEIIPIRAYHYKLPIFGFRIKDFCYITDTNNIPPQEIAKMYNADILVIDALRRKPHLSHFCLHEALEIINKLKPQRAYLTHISHQLDLYITLEKELPTNVFAAYDGLVVEDL